MDEKPNYFLEAVKEPLNLWAMVAVVAMAVYADPPFSLFIALGGLGAEVLYLATMPLTGGYRRVIEQRRLKRLAAERRRAQEELIKSFDPREREAVEYLRWLKNQIYTNYTRFTRSKSVPGDIRTLDAMWERFVYFLDVYRRSKTHLRSFNRQAIQNQIAQAERNLQTADEKTRKVIESNLHILRGRLGEYESVEHAVKLLEAQLQSIENFFGLVNDKVVTMSSVESIASLDFESILSSIEVTRSILEETAPIMSALEAMQPEEAPPLRPQMTTERR
jgi:hypothetical protein